MSGACNASLSCFISFYCIMNWVGGKREKQLKSRNSLHEKQKAFFVQQNHQRFYAPTASSKQKHSETDDQISHVYYRCFGKQRENEAAASVQRSTMALSPKSLDPDSPSLDHPHGLSAVSSLNTKAATKGSTSELSRASSQDPTMAMILEKLNTHETCIHDMKLCMARILDLLKSMKEQP